MSKKMPPSINVETCNLELRPVRAGDLATIFEQQLDETARRMAAFTCKDPTDRYAFNAHWGKILADDGICKRTILLNGKIAGYIVRFEQFGEQEVGYWIGKEYWGKGVATNALKLFLLEETMRPLHARVAKDNVASLRVLEKCGFTITGYDTGFSNARGEDIEEAILILNS